MPYELRIAGRPPARFDTEQEAMAAAGAAVADNADAVPEVVDLTTGQAAAPGADEASRDALTNTIG